MSGTDFLTSAARFFVKRKLHKKCGVFEACKKVTDFFDTLEAGRIKILPAFFFFSGRSRLYLYIYCAYPVSKLSGEKDGRGKSTYPQQR